MTNIPSSCTITVFCTAFENIKSMPNYVTIHSLAIVHRGRFNLLHQSSFQSVLTSKHFALALYQTESSETEAQHLAYFQFFHTIRSTLALQFMSI